MADKNSFLLRIITPDRLFYENQVEMVEFNTTEGEIGVLPGHVPMTVIVKPFLQHMHIHVQSLLSEPTISIPVYAPPLSEAQSRLWPCRSRRSCSLAVPPPALWQPVRVPRRSPPATR